MLENNSGLKHPFSEAALSVFPQIESRVEWYFISHKAWTLSLALGKILFQGKTCSRDNPFAHCSKYVILDSNSVLWGNEHMFHQLCMNQKPTSCNGGENEKMRTEFKNHPDLWDALFILFFYLMLCNSTNLIGKLVILKNKLFIGKSTYKELVKTQVMIKGKVKTDKVNFIF